MEIKRKCSVCGGSGTTSSGIPPSGSPCTNCLGTGITAQSVTIDEIDSLVENSKLALEYLAKILENIKIKE
jgi:DnaJ-class molecular chaperone